MGCLVVSLLIGLTHFGIGLSLEIDGFGLKREIE